MKKLLYKRCLTKKVSISAFSKTFGKNIDINQADLHNYEKEEKKEMAKTLF